jgi:hypothetical protein
MPDAWVDVNSAARVCMPAGSYAAPHRAAPRRDAISRSVTLVASRSATRRAVLHLPRESERQAVDVRTRDERRTEQRHHREQGARGGERAWGAWYLTLQISGADCRLISDWRGAD